MKSASKGLIRFVSLGALWLFGMSFVAGTGLVRAQDGPGAIDSRLGSERASDGSADRFSVNSNLVLIPVVVTDPSGHTVTGLDREHFQLWDDKVEQVVTHFASEDLPVSLSILFDCSGSMVPKMAKARIAVSDFLKVANPEDEFSLVLFSEQAELVQGFTSRPEDIQNRLNHAAARGRTALLDALLLSIDEMKHARHVRRALLIISDGGDNASRHTLSEVKKRVREADAQIYSIGITTPWSSGFRPFEEINGSALLSKISEPSGGRLFEVTDMEKLPDIAQKIGMELRNQYMLGYVPTTHRVDGKYHHVEVKIIQPEGRPPLRVSYRTGYLAPTE